MATASASAAFTAARRRLRHQNAGALRRASTAGHDVFDSRLKALQRSNVARLEIRRLDAEAEPRGDGGAGQSSPGEFDYLRDEVASRLGERMLDIDAARHQFKHVRDVGAWAGHASRALPMCPALDGVESLQLIDTSEPMLELARRHLSLENDVRFEATVSTRAIDAEDGERLDLPDAEADLVLSSMWLHWINDLPGVLTQIRRGLRPDGLFLGTMLGGETLRELRSSFVLAEQQVLGGVGPRMSPLAQVGDVGSLLQRAGFAIPTIDTDLFTIEYPSARSLMRHLSGMGESNATFLRQPYIRRDLLRAVEDVYLERYPGSSDDGSIVATFQVIYMIGWAPSASQAQPMARGSADVSLQEFGEWKPLE